MRHWALILACRSALFEGAQSREPARSNSAKRHARSLSQGALLAVALLLLATSSFAAEKNSVPQGFESGYQLPTVQQPAPRSSLMEIFDVAVLAAFLAAGSYLALRFRKRWAILLLMLAAMGYFGFYRKGCICPIGSIQNVAYAIGSHGPLPWTVGFSASSSRG